VLQLPFVTPDISPLVDPAEEARKLAEKEAEAEMVSDGAAGSTTAEPAATEADAAETKEEL
jgi:hypothetical protein